MTVTPDAAGAPVMVGASGVRYFHLHRRWAEPIIAMEHAAFANTDPADLYQVADIGPLADAFPDGNFVGLDADGEVVAFGFGIRTFFDFEHPNHSLLGILEANGTPSGDVADGDWYYGTTIVVRPDHRRRGIGHELYLLRKDAVRRHGLRGIVAGGMIPGFADHKHEMSADDYIAAVVRGDLYDPILTFQVENGFESPCALPEYMVNAAVDDYASLLVWHDPDYAGPP